MEQRTDPVEIIARVSAHEGRQRAFETWVSPKPVPDMPDHHFRYDPTKALTFTVTTLSWLADPAAESYARQVLALLESTQGEQRRHRRIATARIDLALVLTRAGTFDEAAGQAILALQSGRIVPSSAWRAAEIVRAARAADVAEADDLQESFMLATSTGSPTASTAGPR